MYHALATMNDHEPAVANYTNTIFTYHALVLHDLPRNSYCGLLFQNRLNLLFQ